MKLSTSILGLLKIKGEKLLCHERDQKNLDSDLLSKVII